MISKDTIESFWGTIGMTDGHDLLDCVRDVMLNEPHFASKAALIFANDRYVNNTLAAAYIAVGMYRMLVTRQKESDDLSAGFSNGS